MSRNWNYAKLSKLAKENGGPESLVNKLVFYGMGQGLKIGFSKGVDIGYGKARTEILSTIFIIAGVSLVSYISYQIYIKKAIKTIKGIPLDELEETKRELIKGIEEYNKEY